MAPVTALYLCHIMFINLVQLTNPFFIPAFFSASVHFLPIQTNIPLLPQSRIKQSYNDINWLINESGYFFVGIGLLSTRNQSIRTSKPHTFETTLQSGFFSEPMGLVNSCGRLKPDMFLKSTTSKTRVQS